jgi:uncharacterized membrane protein
MTDGLGIIQRPTRLRCDGRMMNDLTGTEPAVTTVAAAGTGLTAGVYLAFAVMVMPALTHADPASALAAMQRINTLAQRSVFGLVFAAAAIGSAWVLAAPWFDAGDRQAWPTIGAVLSLTAFLITAGVNLPRNRRMTALDPGSPGRPRALADDLGAVAQGHHRARRVRHARPGGLSDVTAR